MTKGGDGFNFEKTFIGSFAAMKIFNIHLSIFFIFLFINIKTSAAIDRWIKFHEEDGIELFRAPKSQAGLIPFRATARLKGDKEKYLMALLRYQDKPLWAPKLKKVTVHSKPAANTFIFSEYYKTPWPATDREFLLKGEVIFEEVKRSSNKSDYIIKLVATNANDQSLKDENHIVCDVKFLNLTLKTSAPGETLVSFEFYGDMKGWMPIWLINIIQKKWPMRFLQGLRGYVAENKGISSEGYLNLSRPLNN